MLKKEPPKPIIEIYNPNYQSRNASSNSQMGRKPGELSRRERKAVQASAAKARYDKFFAAGMTDQAKSDLARLQAVRTEREAAARKRKEEAADKKKHLEQNSQWQEGKRSNNGIDRSDSCYLLIPLF